MTDVAHLPEVVTHGVVVRPGDGGRRAADQLAVYRPEEVGSDNHT